MGSLETFAGGGVHLDNEPSLTIMKQSWGCIISLSLDDLLCVDTKSLGLFKPFCNMMW